MRMCSQHVLSSCCASLCMLRGSCRPSIYSWSRQQTGRGGVVGSGGIGQPCNRQVHCRGAGEVQPGARRHPPHDALHKACHRETMDSAAGARQTLFKRVLGARCHRREGGGTDHLTVNHTVVLRRTCLQACWSIYKQLHTHTGKRRHRAHTEH